MTHDPNRIGNGVERRDGKFWAESTRQQGARIHKTVTIDRRAYYTNTPSSRGKMVQFIVLVRTDL